MTVSARKITAFAKLVAGLADTPNLGSTALLKQWFDSSPEELRVAFNGLIDDLIATVAGSSGTEQIGSAPISGVGGATAYAQLVDLKAQLNAAVIGTIPDGTLDYVKLNQATKDLLTEYGITRQAIINPFEVWQRGTSFTPAAGSYTSDRWYCVSNALNSQFSRQAASPPVGSSAYARMTAGALGGYMNFAQALESDVCTKLKGKNISVSMQMRRDATYDGQYQIIIEKNVTGDTSGGTWVNVATGAFTPTTSWATYKLENIVIPNDGTTNGLRIQIGAAGGTRPLNSYVEFAQPQWNTGSLVLSFQPKSYQQEELDCQRFYEKSYDRFTYAGAVGYAVQPILFTASAGLAASTAGNVGGISALPFKVRKRVNPTAILYDYDGTANAVRVVPADAKRSGVTAISNLKDTGSFQFLSFDNSSTTVISSNNSFGANWTADAEL